MASPLESEAIVAARRALGRQLAALRLACGYNQQGFAPLTGYGRSTLANVETGRQNAPRQFWERCADELAEPTLLDAYDQIQEMAAAERRDAAERARADREERVTAWRQGRTALAARGNAAQAPVGTPNLPAPDSGVTVGPGDSQEPGQSASARQVRAIAVESSDQAVFAGAASLDPGAVGRFRAEVMRLAASYMSTPPLELLGEIATARDMIYAVTGRTRRPAQLTDLYFLSGIACGLLAEVSLDLGLPDASSKNAAAAWAYGESIGHSGLRTWARGMQAAIAFWAGLPHEALAVIGRADEHPVVGPQGVRLRSLEARAWAQLGNLEMTTQAVRAAEEARQTGDRGDELHLEVGGIFAWDEGRQEFCAASARLHLACQFTVDGDRADARRASIQVTRHATRALELFSWRPEPVRSATIETSARADLAAASVLLGDLDSAEVGIAAVTALPVDRRTRRVLGRTATLGRLLSTPAYAGSARAGQLRDQVAAFSAQSAGLPAPRPH